MKYLLSETFYSLNEFFTPINKNYLEIFNTLKKDGIVVMPNHIPNHELNELITAAEEKEFNWESADGADQRLYGLEINKNRNWLGIDDIYSKYISRFRCDSFWMFGKLEYRDNNIGSGGGWHRDSLHRRQLKFMIYLSEVEETSGPFEYVIGSHKIKSKLTLEISQGFGKFRYTSEEINMFAKEHGKSIIKCVSGPGTVVVFDSSGLHRGMPIRSGTRLALTNYMFDTGIPDEISRIYNEKI